MSISRQPLPSEISQKRRILPEGNGTAHHTVRFLLTFAGGLTILVYITKVKEMGFKVKLDTNGSSPSRLKRLLDKGLLDYVAMDIKNDFLNYDKTSGIERINIENIKRSIDIIENSSVDYEFRTTVVKELHDLLQLERICEYLGPNVKYYIQNYKDCDTVLQKGLSGFDNDELINIQNKLRMTNPNVMVRGI